MSSEDWFQDSSLDAYLQLAKWAVDKKVCLFPIKPKYHVIRSDSLKHEVWQVSISAYVQYKLYTFVGS